MKSIVVSAAYLSLLIASGCSNTSEQKSPQAQASAVSDDQVLETQYFRLADEAQVEVLGGKVLSHKELRKSLFEAADKNDDGKLDEAEKAEFKAKMSEAKAEIKAAIVKKYDTNADGKLDKEELKAAFETLKQTIMSELMAVHEAMKAARAEASEKIAAACGKEQKIGASIQGEVGAPPGFIAQGKLLGGDEAADDAAIEAKLETCDAARKEEKDKLRALFAEKIEPMKASMQELQALLGNLGQCKNKLNEEEAGDKAAAKEDKDPNAPADKAPAPAKAP